MYNFQVNSTNFLNPYNYDFFRLSPSTAAVGLWRVFSTKTLNAWNYSESMVDQTGISESLQTHKVKSMHEILIESSATATATEEGIQEATRSTEGMPSKTLEGTEILQTTTSTEEGIPSETNTPTETQAGIDVGTQTGTLVEVHALKYSLESIVNISKCLQEFNVISKKLTEQDAKDNAVIPNAMTAVDNGVTFSSLIRYLVDGVRVAANQSKALGDIRALKFFNLPKTIKGLKDSVEALGSGRLIDDKAKGAADLIENLATTADLFNTSTALLSSWKLVSLATEVSQCVAGLSIFVELAALPKMALQAYSLHKTHQFCQLIAGEDQNLTKIINVFESSTDKLVKDVFGMKKGTLISSLQLIHEFGSEETRTRAMKAMQIGGQKSRLSQVLTALLGLVKFTFAVALLFSPVGQILAACMIVLALLYALKLALKYLDGIEKKAVQLEIRVCLEEVIEFRRRISLREEGLAN